MSDVRSPPVSAERPLITVRAARDGDRAVVAALLADAFADDPAMAWVFPDRADRRRRLPRFFALTARLDADPAPWGLALDPGGTVTAAALWRPPGAWRTPASAMLRHLPALVHAFGTKLPRALALQSAIEAHHPHQPHWYLQFAGCLTAAQGKGYGGAAIRDRLARCDADGLPAALETATPRNVGLYQSLGFVVTGEFRPGDGLQFWSMWRDPR